jgi:hypothetical protein
MRVVHQSRGAGRYDLAIAAVEGDETHLVSLGEEFVQATDHHAADIADDELGEISEDHRFIGGGDQRPCPG